MKFSWSERKREANLKDHGFDFVDARRVFQGPTITVEDDRFEYGERRFRTAGLLRDLPVSIIHTETDTEIRIISFRKATTREAKIFFGQISN